MSKRYDIDKLAREGARQEGPFAYNPAYFDRMAPEIKRPKRGFYWKWITGFLVVSGMVLTAWWLWPTFESEVVLAENATPAIQSSVFQEKDSHTAESDAFTYAFGENKTIASEYVSITSIATDQQLSDGQSTMPDASPANESVSQPGQTAKQEPLRKPEDRPRSSIGKTSISSQNTSHAVENASALTHPIAVNTDGPDDISTDHPTTPENNVSTVESPIIISNDRDGSFQAMQLENISIASAIVSRNLILLDALLPAAWESAVALPAIDVATLKALQHQQQQPLVCWAEAGMRVAKSWSNSAIIPEPIVGAGLTWRLTPRLSWHTGLQGSIRMGESLDRSLPVVQYGFGVDSFQYGQSLRRLYFLQLPVEIDYLVHPRHRVGGGIYSTWLATTWHSELTDWPASAELQPPSVTGYHFLDGHRRLDGGIRFRYSYRLTDLLEIGAHFDSGFRDALNGGGYAIKHPARHRYFGITLRHTIQ